MQSVFLSAEWRKLVMANYLVEPEFLYPYLPYATELDLWQERCYVSLVGFMFMNTKVLGFKVPRHIDFEEVNLRFYVKHQTAEGELRRGVVFIKEIVPRAAISAIANTLFYEHYVTRNMQHQWKTDSRLQIGYAWHEKVGTQSIKVIAENTPLPLVAGSEAEFITEHYWGYTKVNQRKTTEYQVEHPSWMTYPVTECKVNVDFGAVYGPAFAALDKQQPSSVFLAEGSPISVRNKKTISD